MAITCNPCMETGLKSIGDFVAGIMSLVPRFAKNCKLPGA